MQQEFQNNQNQFKMEQQEFIKPESVDLSAMLGGNTTHQQTLASFSSNSPVRKTEEVNQPIKQYTKNVDALAKNEEEINDFYQANLDKKWGFVDRFTNRSMYNEVQEVKTQLFKTSANYRLSFYKTMLDTRLSYLNEKCNAGIKMIKGHYRHQTASFLMSKMEQLSHEVKDKQFNFLNMMKEKYAYLSTLEAYPSMKEKYGISIMEEEGKYLRFLDGLLDKFQSIVDEELTKYN